MIKEGSLDKPERLPIDWQNEEFYNKNALFSELERVFDICHGCRRCVNLCQAFPTLFDLIDTSKTMEIDSVDENNYQKVVSECYLCDLCYMTKCPYVPPHEWKVDFPHLMLRAKAVAFKRDGVKISRKILSAPQLVGKLASIPVINNVVNQASRNNSYMRGLLNKFIGIHPSAHIASYHSKNRPSQILKTQHPKKNFYKEKVAIFATCYGEYNQVDSVLDLNTVLRHNQIETMLVKKIKCCAMPKLELGDIESVIRFAKHNKKSLYKLSKVGYKFIAPIPSCVLMFKNELPLLLPDDKEISAIAKAFFDPFEYLFYLHQNNKLSTNFKALSHKVLYQVACHQRVQNIGAKTKQILTLIPGLKLTVFERCSGHNGSYGVRQNTYENARKIARPIVQKVDETMDYVVSDCILASKHITHLSKYNTPAVHPIYLLKKAYGL